MVGGGFAGGNLGKFLRSTNGEQLNSGCLNFEGMAGLLFWWAGAVFLSGLSKHGGTTGA